MTRLYLQSQIMNRFIFLTMVLRADGTVTTNSGCIHKSYIVYLEIYVVPIGHRFSFFGHWKVMENQCWKSGGTLLLIMGSCFLQFCTFLHHSGDISSQHDPRCSQVCKRARLMCSWNFQMFISQWCIIAVVMGHYSWYNASWYINVECDRIV